MQQKCPRQLLRSMQQFVQEEHLEIMCSEAGEEMADFVLLGRDDFISAMFRMHAAKCKLETYDLKRENRKIS